MSNKAIIESGTLELFAAGMLTQSEASEVHEMCAAEPELLEALNDVELATEALYLANAVQPRSINLSRIKDAISASESEDTSTNDEDNSKVFTLNTVLLSYKKYLSAAAVLLMLSIGANLYLYNNWQSAQNALFAMQQQNTQLASDFEILSNDYQSAEAKMVAFNNPKNVKVALQGLAIEPKANATVVWDPKTKGTFVAVHFLPQPPADKQYQLWAIKDGKIVDAGVFDVMDTIQRVNDVQNGADQFAVTLEPKGGSVNPTLDLMYVAGNVSA